MFCLNFFVPFLTGDALMAPPFFASCFDDILHVYFFIFVMASFSHLYTPSAAAHDFTNQRFKCPLCDKKLNAFNVNLNMIL